MTALINPVAKTVRIYACGGTGLNIVRRYRETKPLIDRMGMLSDERFTLIDSSLANLHNASGDDVFKLPDVDGAGKDRKAMVSVIKPHIPSIVVEHVPGDLNIVVFNTSGGTGSVIGPLLMLELLKQGHSVVGVVTGSPTSLKSSTNQLETLTDLERLVEVTGRPVVIHYTESDPNKNIMENDVVSQFAIGALSILASGKNLHLDSADIRSMLDYNRVTHHEPALVQLSVYADAKHLQSAHNSVYGYIALMNKITDVAPIVEADYDKTGYLPDTSDGYNCNFFYTVSADRLDETFKELRERRKKNQLKQRVETPRVRLSDEDSGLLF